MAPSPAQLGPFAFAVHRARGFVGKMTGRFHVEVDVRSRQRDAALAAGLVHEYARARKRAKMTMRVDLVGVYGPGGVPTAEVAFEEDRMAGGHARFEADGADYGLRFTGDVALADGHVLIAGRLDWPYDERVSFDVRVDAPLEHDDVDWTGYTFTSLQEAGRAPMNEVHHLTLNDSAFTTLPAEVTNLAELRSLSILSLDTRSPLPLADLTPALGKLRHLERLSVSGTVLTSLPDEISDLGALVYLSVTGCQLGSVPDGVWKLPALESLILRDNALTALPESVDLPALHALNLERNRLATVPAGFADLPELRRLSLSGNPLTSLPNALRSVGVDLPIEERQRLLPKPYPGAESGYDASVFQVRDPDRLQQLEALLEAAAPVAPGAERFARAAARPAIGFRRADKPADRLGSHRFGGMPDLPEGWEYPRFRSDYEARDCVYEFIAQVDCEALADLQDYLPRTGVLYVFLSTIHDLYGPPPSHRPVLVQHYDGPRDALRPGARFSFTRDDYFEMMEDSAYERMDVEAEAIVSLAPSYPLRVNAYQFRAYLPTDEAAVDTLVEAYEGVDEAVRDEAEHDLGGYGFSQNELPETEVALAVGGDPADWFTLLTVRSRGDMQWGDAGDVYAVIHKADLARADFSRVEATMYSS